MTTPMTKRRELLRRSRRSEHGGGDSWRGQRIIVAVGTAAGLICTAVYACLDANGNDPCYHPPGGGEPRGQGGGSSGLSGGEIAGIAVGAAGVGYGIWWALAKDSKPHENDEEKPPAAGGLPLPGSRATQARLIPQNLVLRPGEQCFFQLEVRAGANEAWRPVTALPGASVELVGEDSLLVRLGGCRNGFCLPVPENRVGNGSRQVVRGTFATNGGESLIAEAAVRIAPDDELHPSFGSTPEISPCSGS